MCSSQNMFKLSSDIVFVPHTYVFRVENGTRHPLFPLFFARFRSEVIEMEGWNLQYKETYLNNNLSRRVEFEKENSPFIFSDNRLILSAIISRTKMNL